VEALGKPEKINVISDQSHYEPWVNISEVFIKSFDLIEEAYAFSNWWFFGLTAMDGYFSLKYRTIPLYLLRKVLAPAERLLFKYDYLGTRTGHS
jgi:hypothetical protein